MASNEARPQFDPLEVVQSSPASNKSSYSAKSGKPLTPDELQGLEKTFDYGGDMILTLKDGRSIEGYIFDRRPGATLEDSPVRLLPKDSGPKLTVR